MNTLAEIQISYSHKVKAADRIKITSSREATEQLRAVWNQNSIEHVEESYLLLMNRANQLLGFHYLGRGGVSGCVIDAKVVFQVALKANASALIIAHNHPSGNTEPSQQDINITKRLKSAGELLDIAVHDHVILTADSFYSFADNGRM